MALITQKSDSIGAISSTLCLIHCTATPLFFMIQGGVSACCSATPIWWKSLDYVFLLIAFVAIYFSAKHTVKPWMKYALWISWGALFFVIINEKMVWFSLHENLIYLPTIVLIGLHLYNRKYCKCQANQCCVQHR